MSRVMKDSGVEWIGEIPEGWGVMRLKYAYDNSNGSAVRVGPFGSALPSSDYILDGEWIYNQRTVLDENFTTNNTCVSKEKANSLSGFRVYQGDILITTRGTLGRIAIVPDGAPSGILHPCIIRFRVKSNIVMSELLKYMFNDSDFFIKQIEFANNSTTIEALYSYNLCDLILPAIPINEQSQIVSFLDRKCTAIDTAIEKTKKLIEKLEEYKKAVITKAVTKGIDPNVKMKDSGVEWIGEIPENWDVSKFKFHTKVKSERNPGNAIILSLYREHGIVIKDSRDDNHNRTSLDTSLYRYVETDDFVVNKMKAWQGSVAVSGYTGVVSPAYYVYKITDAEVYPQYLHYLLRSCYKDEFRRLSGGIRIGQWDLPSEALENTLILQPPYEEQIRITEHIQKRTTAVEQLIQKKKTAIEKWNEYKKSLIYYAVTGKIDCRSEVN